MNMCYVAPGNHKSLTKTNKLWFLSPAWASIKRNCSSHPVGATVEEGASGRDEMCLRRAATAFEPGAWGCVSDARGFVGWSRRGLGGRSSSPGASTGVFKLEKQGSRESQAHMLWLTLRQEVDWCDDFMAQFSSAGDLNSEIASGQRRIKWFFF